MKRGELYPSWRYHQTEAPVLCRSKAQDDELGDEWSDAPFPSGDVLESAQTPEAESDAPKKKGKKLVN